MSLATELLRQVQEAKATKDEMGIPSYDNLNTPNNHVGNTSNATKERKVSGLGDRKVKHPTANIGTPHKEKGRDMEGVKGVKVSESAVQDLGLNISGGMLRFKHPTTGQEYQIEWDADVQNFLANMMRRTQDTGQVFDLLMDYMESGPGQDPRAMGGDRHPDADVDVGTDPMIRHRGGSYDPRNRVGLAASKGTPYPLGEDGGMFGNNPVAQALSMRPAKGGMVYMASPDGSAAMLVPMSAPVQKALHSYMTNPDARADTHAAADRLFKLVGAKVPGVQATQPQGPAASRSQSGVRGRGVDPSAGSGLSLEPMDTGGEPAPGQAVNPYSRQKVSAGMGESAHKTADGEMATPKVGKPSPAKMARVRGKQDDEPTNRGNPGTSHEEKGQKKPQFTNTPKHTKGGTRGENENKTMKKMHENIEGLEQLLGRKLQLKGTEFSG